MKVDNVDLTETQRLRLLLSEETAGERSPPADPIIEDVERLMAADLILRMRRVKDLAPRWSEHSRAQYAKQFEALSLQFCAAAAYLKRHRVDEEVPAWLREG